MYDSNWKIGGIGGMGAMGVGLMFSKILFRSGYFVCDYNEYNSIIKGGNNSYQVRFSTEKVHTISQKIDLLLALDEYTIGFFKDLKNESSFMLCDWALVKNKEGIDAEKVLDVPFSMLNKTNGGDEIMKNIVGLGASLGVLNADLEIAKSIIKEQFLKKGDDVINKNTTLLEVGYNYVKEKYSEKISAFNKTHGVFNKLNERKNGNVLVAGNEAIALAAIASGIGYYAAYPMTPSSSILHFLAPLASKYNFVVKHAEDEIAALNSAIGASWAGARSMVATAGGGFSLMVEAFGMAAMTETPVVVGVITRPGPSTGMPTWTDQGDLRFVLHSSQGEFLRLVFTPGDPQECFELTKLAFSLTEKYHLPAIILSDKYLAEGKWSCQLNNNILNIRNGFINQAGLSRMEKYERYADTSSGVTPRSIPGMEKGEHLANSDEHDYYGLSNETSEMRMIQIKKRTEKKLSRLILDLPKHEIFGNPSAKVGIITFGSMKNPVLESFKTLKNIKHLNLKYVSPFPKEEVQAFLNSIDKFFVIEGNMTGQLASLIAENNLRRPDDMLLKDDGRPIYSEEIIEFMKKHGY